MAIADSRGRFIETFRKEWFPQLELNDVAFEEICLVDDVADNFHSKSSNKVMRCVKIAHYDAEYREQGFLEGMGGLGAHDRKTRRRP